MHLTRRRPVDSYPIGPWRLGNRAAKNDDPGEAEALYTKAIAIQPDMFQAYFNRGIVRMRLGEPHLALTDFDATLRLSPTFPKCLVQRGLANEMLGNYTDAHKDFLKATDIEPRDPEGYYCLGRSFQRQSQPAQALKRHRTALTLRVLHDLRGLITVRLGEVLSAVPQGKALVPEEKPLVRERASEMTSNGSVASARSDLSVCCPTP